MDECKWDFRLLWHYVRMTKTNRFKVIGKRRGQWIELVNINFTCCYVFFKNKNTQIVIELPKGFMNTAITTDNFFIADTNNSDNWDSLKFPLPKGKWSIHSVSNKKVILKRK